MVNIDPKFTDSEEEGVVCKCGQKMVYKGMNSWGEPSYGCQACGATVKL